MGFPSFFGKNSAGAFAPALLRKIKFRFRRAFYSVK